VRRPRASTIRWCSSASSQSPGDAQQLGERRARLDPLGRELDRAPVGEHGALEILERTREQAAELLVHVGERGPRRSDGAPRTRAAPSGLAPFAEAAQQARLRERGVRAARVALGRDPERERRLAPLALLLERAALEIGERGERDRVADVRGRAVGRLDRASSRPASICSSASAIHAGRAAGRPRRGAQMALGRLGAPPRRSSHCAARSRRAARLARARRARPALDRRDAGLDPVELLEHARVASSAAGAAIAAQRGAVVHERLLGSPASSRQRAEQRAVRRALGIAAALASRRSSTARAAGMVAERDQRLAVGAERRASSGSMRSASA
jgi:hypothetical protein